MPKMKLDNGDLVAMDTLLTIVIGGVYVIDIVTGDGTFDITKKRNYKNIAGRFAPSARPRASSKRSELFKYRRPSDTNMKKEKATPREPRMIKSLLKSK